MQAAHCHRMQRRRPERAARAKTAIAAHSRVGTALFDSATVHQLVAFGNWIHSTMRSVMKTSIKTASLVTCGLLAACAGCLGHSGPEGHQVDAPGQIATPDNRTAFVQLFEWKWTDVARECESYLGPKGFAAVQISPPNEHNWIPSGDGAPYPWWMRYQPVSYRLDRSRSGTRAELIDMVNRCNAVGV